MASRMLVSKYIKEDGNNRLIKRASNIATWFLNNYGSLQGTLIPSKNIRIQINTTLGSNNYPSPGDLKAHGQAINMLNLNSDFRKNQKHIDMSLINAKRCTSFLLGKGKIAKSLYLKNGLVYGQPTVGKMNKANITDNDLIDLALTLDQKRLDDWESHFIHSLNKNFRSGLSGSQRRKLMITINERA